MVEEGEVRARLETIPTTPVLGCICSDGHVRITIFASGSRGDVQPMIALALGLDAAGHAVTLAAPRNFRDLVEQRGITFHPFSVDVDDLMRSDTGRSWLGHSSHSPLLEVRLVARLVNEWAERMADESIALAGTADLFISGVMTLDVVDALVRVGGGRHVIALLAPFRASRSGPAGLQSPQPRADSPANLLAGVATELALGYGFGSPGRAVRRKLGLSTRRVLSWRSTYRRTLSTTPTVLGVSPLVVPVASDWPTWIYPSGYWSLPASRDWQPEPRLRDFLEQGEPPVYVGFGSMSTREPQATLTAIVRGLKLSGRRGLIHSGGADLAGVTSGQLDDSRVLVVDDVPHDWLFSQMGGIVHHGGAGTTAAALHSGVPSGVVSHIGDQPYWGRRIYELGVGAAPIARHELTPSRLAHMIGELALPAVVARANTFGEQVRGERGVDRAVSFIERW